MCESWCIPMDSFAVETNKFEIIAILRDLKLKSIELLIMPGNQSVYITSVDHAGFGIPRASCSMSIGEKVSFTVKSNDISLDCITSCSEKKNNQDYFLLPKNLEVHQRRLLPRFTIDSEYSFRCYGKFNDGMNYNFRIANVSHGGCGIIIDSNVSYKIPKLNGKTLRNAILDFGHDGIMMISLIIVNDVFLPKEKKRIVSCKFKVANRTNRILLDKIIIMLLIEKKRKHKKLC